jgi:hypothetical protein
MPTRRISIALLAAAALSILPAGCAGGFPRLFGPRGPVQTQRLDASYYDPYPDDKLGPEVVGGRPRDYQKTLPQAEQNQPYGPKPRRTW